jgi:rhodanese-related sulfurtransferase
MLPPSPSPRPSGRGLGRGDLSRKTLRLLTSAFARLRRDEPALSLGEEREKMGASSCARSGGRDKKVFVVCREMAHAGWLIPLKDKTIQCETPERPGAAKILLEALAVLAAGIAVALAANQISPRGLVLGRNYFPQGTKGHAPVANGIGSPAATAHTNPAAISPAQLMAARLKEQGLQWLEGSRAAQLFRDPRFQQGKVVFVDARDEAPYQEGHIPGAYEFDPYRPEKYFPTVFPVCQAAEQIVVYCSGGDCDDSESAAITLRDVGVATNKLFIYGGGFAEWTTNGLPVEIGGRNSGSLRSTNK